MAAMSIKQKTMKKVVGQFHRPHGLGGQAAGWVMATRGSNRKRNVWAAGLLDVQPDDRVLEVGFGPGIAIRAMAERASRGLVCGIDHSQVMVRQATRRNAAAVRTGRVELRVGSVTELPTYAEPFDKVLAVNNAMMWDDPSARLRELRALMRPGGTIAIALQPRGPGSSDETADRAAVEISEQLTSAGFADLRVETLDLQPTKVVCVLGENPG
jgi:ubiquinone/menaquinone biosynthesis C-methylase UbiE